MIALTTKGRREQMARRIMHNEVCRSGRWCRGDNEHSRRAYASLGAQMAATPDRAALLVVLHDRTCPQQINRSDFPMGCQQTRAHAVELVTRPYVRRLIAALHPREAV